jgi:hypothetical protein
MTDEPAHAVLAQAAGLAAAAQASGETIGKSSRHACKSCPQLSQV